MASSCGLKAFLLKPTMTSVDRCAGRRLGSASSPALEKTFSTLASCVRWHAICLKAVKCNRKDFRSSYIILNFNGQVLIFFRSRSSTVTVTTPAPYLRSFSADSAYYLFRIRTQDQNIIPTQEPRPNGVPQTQYGDRRCPLCPGRHLGSL